jgi:hypothetical protein
MTLCRSRRPIDRISERSWDGEYFDDEEIPMSECLLKIIRNPLAAGGFLCALGALAPALAANAAGPRGPVPDFSSNGVSWAGFVAPRIPSEAVARTFNDYSLPASGPGPVTDDPAHPYINNENARETNRQPTYRVANLNNPNLKPWVVDALRKQNELALAGKQGQTREARCWEVGVPTFHLNPGAMYFVQTEKEVTLFLAGRVRRIFLDVPHSKNLKPSWYGESVGHYEGGDTLVVDTIGFNDKSFVDSYRTPHTTDLHVTERFKLADGGKTLDVSFTVEDPGAFNTPWSGTRSRQRVQRGPLDGNDACAEDHNNYFNLDIEQVPTAEKPDF